MSDDERAFSDEEDLFGSESEDQGSDVEHSLDVASLSMDSLYVRSPLPAEAHDDEGTPVRETDQSDAGGFDTDGVTSSAADLARTEGELDPHDEDSVANNENGEEINRSGRSAKDARDKVVGRADLDTMKLSSDEMPHCESPRLRESGVQLEVGENEHQVQEDDRVSVTDENVDDTQTTDVLHDVLLAKSTSSADEPDDTCDPGLLTTSAREGKAPSRTEPDDLAALTTSSEAFTTEPSLETTQKNSMGEENTVAELSPREIPEQQTDVTSPSASDPVESVAKAPVYTVESLFPVVYENRLSPRAMREKVTVSISSSDTQRLNRERRRQVSGSNPAKSIACRLAALQSQLDAAHNDLANVNRTHKLHLAMVETDNTKLTQRNARMKTQLSVATADLQRSNAELARLKTENELYAAKLPQLQAELLQETSQVDETQAQSVQTQLALTQLKARSHVLQTRTLSLEAQNNKLTQQLRECQQQLKRKTAALVQQTEKANRLEADMNELKTTHGHEKLDWKHRLASALQRFEHDKAKLEAQASSKERKELREAKDRAEKAAAKRRVAEAAAAKMEEQLKHHKRELAAANDTIHRQVAEVRTLEALLRKAHRTEATLRSDLAACKTKLRSLQDEKKRQLARPAPMQVRRRQQIPIELLLPLTDSSDDEESNQEDQACSRCLRSSKVEVEPQSPFVCTDCPRRQDQLRQLQQDLRRVRSLHAAELQAQASVLDALLQVQQEQVAVTPV